MAETFRAMQPGEEATYEALVAPSFALAADNFTGHDVYPDLSDEVFYYAPRPAVRYLPEQVNYIQGKFIQRTSDEVKI